MITYIPGITPTRVAGFAECQRKWALIELFGHEDPGNWYATWGTAMHLVLEQYYANNIMPPDTEHGRAVAPHLPFLPDRGDDIKVEMEVEYDGIVGTVDMHYYSEDTDTVHLYDWKSIGKAKNKKSKNALLKHPQAVVYGLAAMKHYGCKKIELHWRYITRDEPYELGLVDIETTWEKLEKIYLDLFADDVQLMKEKQGALGPEEFPKAVNKNACWAIRNGPSAPPQRCTHEITCKMIERKLTMGTLSETKLFTDFMDLDAPAPAPAPAPTDINPPDVPIELIVDDSKVEPKTKLKPKPKTKSKSKTKGKIIVSVDDTPAQPPAPKTGFTYYRNCVPAKGIEYTLVNVLLKPATAVVETSDNVAYWSMVPYGGGKAALASVVRELIQRGDLNGKHIVANGYSDEVTATESEFINHADVFIIGVK